MDLTVYRRTVLNAIEVAGTEKKLAQYLGISAEEVRTWASGQAIPPVKVLLALTDIASCDSLRMAAFRYRTQAHAAPRRKAGGA